MILNDELFVAAEKITDEHMKRLRVAERHAHNKAVDQCIEVVSEWIANGRDELALFDTLQDLKRWIA